MKLLGLVAALGMLAVALPLAAPTASALCVTVTFCPNLCVICDFLIHEGAQEAASAHCELSTDAQTTTATCGSMLTGPFGDTANAPLPALLDACGVGVGVPDGIATYHCTLP